LCFGSECTESSASSSAFLTEPGSPESVSPGEFPESRAASPVPTNMSTLSRREEDTLFKATKANALRECDELVKGTLIVILLITEPHPLRSLCRVRRRTYRFSCLGLPGEVQGRSGLCLPIVGIIFNPYTLVTYILPAHDQRACSLCGTNTSGYATSKRNNYHHSSPSPR